MNRRFSLETVWQTYSLAQQWRHFVEQVVDKVVGVA